MAWFWTLREEGCPGCGICADLCPHPAIAMPPERALPAAVPGACAGCMICAEECPFDAIVVWQRALGVTA